MVLERQTDRQTDGLIAAWLNAPAAAAAVVVQ